MIQYPAPGPGENPFAPLRKVQQGGAHNGLQFDRAAARLRLQLRDRGRVRHDLTPDVQSRPVKVGIRPLRPGKFPVPRPLQAEGQDERPVSSRQRLQDPAEVLHG